MLIARSKADATHPELLILGLSDLNVLRLGKGQPILLKKSTHGEAIPDGLEIVIIAGKTEADIKKELVAAGLIDEAQVVEKPFPDSKQN